MNDKDILGIGLDVLRTNLWAAKRVSKLYKDAEYDEAYIDALDLSDPAEYEIALNAKNRLRVCCGMTPLDSLEQ